jgi:diaminohydroxyphosphoribosylaminopyrimidine deaminase/5-amino-6-(5-phosphoribosylamino)uracil reductase
MMRAIALAHRGEGWVEPNPMVGCVIVREGVCVGEGYHRRFGGAHAEVDAINSLVDRDQAIGATAYVTLEPCCHTGKTPPCTDAIIAAGLKRVVVAMRDPFSLVDGDGIQRLQDAGIRVDIGAGSDAAEDLNAPYLKRLRQERPWVIGKWAMSLDGRIATTTGDSQWISGPLSRGEVHRLRGRVDAIIVGGGTAVSDNPTLTARPTGQRTACRIVFAGDRLPARDSNLIRTIQEAPVMIVSGPRRNATELNHLEKLGVRLFGCQSSDRLEMIHELLAELGRRKMTNVLVEGGSVLLSSFAAIDELDEIHAYVAPKLIGGTTAPGPVGGNGFAKLVDSPRYRLVESTRFDDDVRFRARRIR